jgi:ABC-type antimicrobial peptide transport system permease subunit
MTTALQPTIATSTSPPPARNRPSRSGYGLGGVIAAVGLVAGLVFGITSYQDSQQQIDTFARMSVPGTATVQVDGSGRRVAYYEGNESVGIDNLTISVSDPTGATVEVKRFEGELIYETPDLTKGRAVATFDAGRAGAYEVEVSGLDTGQLTVGESFSRLALPGVLAGLAIAGLSVVAGFVLWLVTFIRRSQ